MQHIALFKGTSTKPKKNLEFQLLLGGYLPEWDNVIADFPKCLTVADLTVTVFVLVSQKLGSADKK